MSAGDQIFTEILEETRELNRKFEKQLETQNKFIEQQNRIIKELVNKYQETGNVLEHPLKFIPGQSRHRLC